MKRLFWILPVLALALIAAWRFWSPADLTACPPGDGAPGPLSAFVHGYFERNGRVDWRELDNRFDVLSTPQGRVIADQPQAYACEAVQILQSPAFSQSEKVYATALMFRLPISQYLGFMDRSHQLYEQASIDREVLTLVVHPRGTAVDYWWLPAWRQRFNRDAPDVLEPGFIRQVLSGRYWFDYPGNGF
ncbi:hypothetical protein [Pseudomonas sp. R16(2017)]|uniref:hypothetical protein n=1 Tax=Pseudomonas sp. R16(2017) TaxID=1981704 RepID=UPI000A1FD84C|nr:hypothetical protein [Pseudomonas sp. R16(2017)]